MYLVLLVLMPPPPQSSERKHSPYMTFLSEFSVTFTRMEDQVVFDLSARQILILKILSFLWANAVSANINATHCWQQSKRDRK
jgi:hypothetical protein